MSWTPWEQVASHRPRRRQGVDVPDTFPEDHPIHVRNAPTGWAPTKSCPGCFYGPKRFDHSKACVARLKAMREDVPQAAPAAPAVPAPLTLVPPPPGLEPVAMESAAPSDPEFVGERASGSGGIAPINAARDDLEELGRPQSPRPTVRFRTKKPATPTTIPKRARETSGATSPSKSDKNRGRLHEGIVRR